MFTVPSDLTVHHELFTALGVKQQFTTLQYAKAIQRLSVSSPGPLSEQDLDSCLHLIKGAAEARTRLGPSSSPLLLPDSDGFMQPSSDLYFNDAPWLENPSIPLCHPSIPLEACEILGALSLRYSHEASGSTTRLPCPSLQKINDHLSLLTESPSILPPSSLLISRLVSLADHLGANKVRFYLDYMSYGTQSLLHPGLAQFQGPSLSFVALGVSLGPDNLSSLMQANGSTPSLLTCFMASELLQVLSGSSMVLLDPAGHTQASSEGKGPRAKVYNHLAPGADLLSTFCDQYSVFNPILSDLGLSVDKPLSCLIIRMPLTLMDSKAHSPRLSLNDLCLCTSSMHEDAARGLLFLRKVSEVSYRELTGSDITLVFKSSCVPISQDGSSQRFNPDPPGNSNMDLGIAGFLGSTFSKLRGSAQAFAASASASNLSLSLSGSHEGLLYLNRYYNNEASREEWLVLTSYDGPVTSQVAVLMIKRDREIVEVTSSGGLFNRGTELCLPTSMAERSHGSSLCHQPLLISSSFSLSSNPLHLLDLDPSLEGGVSPAALDTNRKALDHVAMAWSKSIESLILNHKVDGRQVLTTLLPRIAREADDSSKHCLRKVRD